MPANATKLGIYAPRRRPVRKIKSTPTIKPKPRSSLNDTKQPFLWDHTKRGRAVIAAESEASPLHKRLFCITNRNDPLADRYFFNDSGDLICSKCLALDDANLIRAAYFDIVTVKNFRFLLGIITRLIRDFPHNARELVYIVKQRAKGPDFQEPDAAFFSEDKPLKDKFQLFMYSADMFLATRMFEWLREVYAHACRVLHDYATDKRDLALVVKDQLGLKD